MSSSDGGPFLYAFPQDSAAFQFCPRGSGRMRDWTPLALTLLPPGLILDIGAHDGTDAIQYANAGHTVLSFEPNPAKALNIERRLNKSGVASQITFFSAAVSEEVGEQRFWSFDGPGGSEQDSLSKPLRSGQNLTSALVPVTTIDTVLADLARTTRASSVLWAKIDAQGHDGEIVLGAKRTISKGQMPTFLMEVSPRLAPDGMAKYMKSFEFLDHHGYRCFDCDTSGHAVMRWMRGVPFPPKLGRYPTRTRLHELHNFSVMLWGENQGGWTNVLCTTERRIWGSS